MALLAFHGDDRIKTAALSRLARYRQDEQIDVTVRLHWESYSEWGSPCGCLLHSSDVSQCEPKLGIPAHMGVLLDTVCWRLPRPDALRWPERLLASIDCGADIGAAWPMVAAWMLTAHPHGVLAHCAARDERELVLQIGRLYETRVLDEPTWAEALRRAMALADAVDAADRAAGRDWSLAGEVAWAAKLACETWNPASIQAAHEVFDFTEQGAQLAGCAVCLADFGVEAAELPLGEIWQPEHDAVAQAYYGALAEAVLERLRELPRAG